MDSHVACVVLVTWAAFSGIVSGYDRKRIKEIPPPLSDFILEKLMGRWYVKARLASCTWHGSNQFDDWDVHQTLEKDRTVLAVETWRSKKRICTTMRTTLTEIQGKPSGSLIVQDPIGDVLTGEQYVVSTDYITFAVYYGCVKKNVDRKYCDDPWITVLTRHPHPTPKTFKIIEDILIKLFGVSLSDMRMIQHNEACTSPPT